MTFDGEGRDPVLDGVATAVMEYIDRPATILKYVLVAEWMDEDGDKHIYCDTMDDQRASETLGLISFADATERARIVCPRHEDDA